MIDALAVIGLVIASVAIALGIFWLAPLWVGSLYIAIFAVHVRSQWKRALEEGQ